MYINELGVREINTYYSRQGSRRTAHIRNFADYMETAKTDKTATQPADNESACCETCRQTNQLLLRLLSNQLYAPNALNGMGYSAAGSGALAAYQSLSRYFGSNPFNLL